MPRLWQHTRIVFSEDSVTIARDKPVQSISKPTRQDPSPGTDAPDSTKFFTEIENGIGPRQHALVGFSMIQDHANSVEIFGVESVAP